MPSLENNFTDFHGNNESLVLLLFSLFLRSFIPLDDMIGVEELTDYIALSVL